MAPRTDMPPETQEIFFDFHWDHAKLLKAEGAVELIPTTELLWQLDLPIWQRFPGQTLFDLKPSEVLADPAKFPDRRERIARADLRFPLVMMRNLRGQWVIMDGYHRLCRAQLEGVPSLAVKKLSREKISEVKR